MSLGLYSKTHPDYLIDDEHPFTITFDGILGGSLAKCVYLRNDNVDRWYEDITVSLISDSPFNITDGSHLGWEWKLYAGSFVPTADQWDLIVPGTTINITSALGSSLSGDSVTYLPVWVLVSIPANQKIQRISDVSFRISYTEHLV